MVRGTYVLRVVFRLVMMVVVGALMLSCKPSMPSDILSQGEMEDILYDYYLVQGAAEVEGLTPSDTYAYRLAVLKKHGVTQAEFDSTMVYYTRHTELLKKVYENVYDRLNNEAVALGATASDLDKFGDQSEKGDTANIWKDSRSMVIPAMEPFNYTSFVYEADTSFHKGDRFLLEFDTKFLMQDGMRSGVALLAIQFANDSVATQYRQTQNTQHYSLMVEDRDSLGIKKVSGYMMLNNPGNQQNSKTTLRLMILQNIRLIKMHVRDRKPVTRPVVNKPATVASPDTSGMPQKIIPPAIPSRDGRLPLKDNAPKLQPNTGKAAPVGVTRRMRVDR